LRDAINAIAERRADVLVVFSADRLVRSTIHLLQLVGRIEAAGGHVASLQDGGDLDTTTDIGELMLFLRGWYSRMELRLTRRRIVAGLEQARREGKKLGRPRVDVDPARVKKLRTAGKSWSAIASELGSKPTTVRRLFLEQQQTKRRSR
jgi:DNA invertase Pin-like site-specific DNA recombinase